MFYLASGPAGDGLGPFAVDHRWWAAYTQLKLRHMQTHFGCIPLNRFADVPAGYQPGVSVPGTELTPRLHRAMSRHQRHSHGVRARPRATSVLWGRALAGGYAGRGQTGRPERSEVSAGGGYFRPDAAQSSRLIPPRRERTELKREVPSAGDRPRWGRGGGTVRAGRYGRTRVRNFRAKAPPSWARHPPIEPGRHQFGQPVTASSILCCIS